MAQPRRIMRSRRIEVLLVIAAIAGVYLFVATRAIDHVGRLVADWFMGASEDPIVVAPGAGPIVDGFPVGLPATCAPGQCDQWISLARSVLDDRDPAHAEVINVRMYLEDLTNPLLFEPGVIHARTGTVIVVVFDLADGAKRATGVYCGVGPCVGLATYPH
jgi:hypothetical protein